MFDFAGKNVFITGAAAGIGLASARAFARAGAHVIATDRDPDVLAAALDGEEGSFERHALDVTAEADITRVAQAIGGTDILFNCAGWVPNGTLLECSRADWDRVFEINVTGTFLVTRALLPGMIAAGGGVIVNMASVVSSVTGLPNRFAYGASKAAVIGMTKSIARDYVGAGIRCNAICPGTVDTPSLRQRLSDTGDYEAAREAFIARQPMGRIATAEEIAALVLYTASDEAAFVTGQAIAIDGGISI